MNRKSVVAAKGECSPGAARPTAAQLAWQDMELEMFACLDPCAWQDKQDDDLSTPLAAINPRQLDADQWAATAEALGAKQILFVAKHAGGFCWWPTQTSNYGVKETPWRGGRGDLMAEVSAACRRHGMRLGVYLFPYDKVQHAGLSGRCATPEEQARYNAIYRRQLEELLTRYGEIAEVWFDGSVIVPVGDILARFAPDAMVFQGPQATIRWVGNEDGFAPYPAWNSVKAREARSGCATAAQGDPDGDAWLPLEVDTTIRRGLWFWNRGTEDKLKTLDQLMEIYYRSVGHGCVLLLNSNPDTTGLIPEPDARRTAEFGSEIRRRFGKPLAATSGDMAGEQLEILCNRPIAADHVVSMEAIAQGERIREYAVDGLCAGQWKELARGPAVGHKKIDFFKPQIVSGLRFRTLDSRGPPVLREFSAHHAGVIPDFSRGGVDIWNPFVAGQWGAEVRESWTILDLDISRICADARQYEIDFAPAPGAGAVEIGSVCLVQDSVAAPGFTRPATAWRWNLNITTQGMKKALRVRMRRAGAKEPRGEVTIRERA